MNNTINTNTTNSTNSTNTPYNLVRFFIDDDTATDIEYTNIPIPQLYSTVFLYDKPYYIFDITYIFGNDFNLIDVYVTTMYEENDKDNEENNDEE